MNLQCFTSSFLFSINSIVAYSINEEVYCILFFALFITSLIVHTKNTIFTNLIDKISILGVVLYGGYLFFNKLNYLLYSKTVYETPIFIFKIFLSSFIITTFISTIYLYCYGYYCKDYCFYHDKVIADIYHSLLHLISFLGHLGIMIL